MSRLVFFCRIRFANDSRMPHDVLLRSIRRCAQGLARAYECRHRARPRSRKTGSLNFSRIRGKRNAQAREYCSAKRKTGRADARHGSGQHHVHGRSRTGAARRIRSGRLAHADGHHSPRQAHRRRASRRSTISCRWRSSNDLVFGGWDVFPDDAYQAAAKAGVLDAKDLAKVQKFLKTIKPMKAAFDQNYVKNLQGTNVKKGKTKFDLAEQIREDIRDFKKKNKLRPPGDGLVRLDRSLPEARSRAQGSGVVRKSDEGESSRDRALDALRLRRDQRRRALRQRRAESHRGYSGA